MLNINRDFVRTSLVEGNINSTTIDTTMGHWITGKEFFGYCSSISFQKMALTIYEELSKIQLEIGFKAITSEI